MGELGDAHEHLGDLINEMKNEGKIDVESYAVDISHIYAHLNRAWNSREFKGEMSEKEWEKYQMYPNDLEPLA